MAAFAAMCVVGVVACDTGEPPFVLDEGHVDGFAVAVDDGEFDLHVHDDVYGVERSPAETVLHARPGSQTSIPANPAYSFLGAAGADIWVLPQVQDSDLLWLGWETEEIPTGILQGNALQWKLMEVDGPGSFHIFTTGALGQPTVLFDSDDGLPDTVSLPVGTHAHGNWTFGAPGQYTVTFQAIGTLADGTPLDSGPVDYTLTVGQYECGDVDDMAVDPATVAGGQSVEVSYVLENCGTASDSLGVSVTLKAPASCGGAVTTTPVAPTTVTAGGSVAGSATVTAPSCPGTYQVKAKPTGVPNSYAAVTDLHVD
jgi:surface-anchored protein